MGIDPLEAGNILGEDDEDEEHKVYLEERIEYIPERRASQMIIDFDPKAKTVINYPFVIHFIIKAAFSLMYRTPCFQK